MRPAVSAERAKQLAAQYWGMEGPLEVTELAGYDDRNMRVHNDADSAEPLFAEAQNALLLQLQAAGIPVPAPLPVAEPTEADAACSRGGDPCTLRIVAEDGRQHAVRALSWLPGKLLVDVAQSAELCRQLGALLGRTNRALQAWDSTASSALRRPYDWNLLYLPATFARIRPALEALPGLDLPLLDAVVQHVAAATAAAGDRLRCGIIHSDANERNVLVDEQAAAAAAAAADGAQAAAGLGNSGAAADTGSSSAAGSGAPLITGLLDWGDASWCWLAAEPAAAAVYIMLLEAHTADPLPAAQAVLAGYEAELALEPAERAVLRTLCCARLAQSLSLGAYAAAREPSNAEYLLGTQRNGWRLLRMLWGLSDHQFLATLS
ncbi:hypothetical protein ABPG75_003758 [Micractinium tetrahymenae]